ncbi:MAG TPA: trigger factor [Polyangiaceae bacterium]
MNRLSPVLVEFDVQVAAERVRAELDKAYSAVAKNAKIRGYRPGKAPRRVLMHMYGARIADDVAQRLVDETFPQAVSQENVQPVSNPAIERQKLTETEPFSYKARVEIIPKIESVIYEGLPATRPKSEATDEQIEREVARLRGEHSTLVAPDPPRPAANGDVVVIDFTVTVAGRLVRDAGASDLQVELGAGSLFSAIEEALSGKSVGEETTAEVELPTSHAHPRLRGKRATFSISVKDIKRRVLPEADDEFAKDLGEFETLAELREHLKKGVEKQLSQEVSGAVAEQLVRELARANPVPVPPSLVERQARISEQEVLTRARSQGQQVSGVGSELREQIRRESEVKVRAGLLMAEIAKKEGIQIGEAEIEEGLKELAEQTGKNLAKLRVEYRDPKQREMLLGMLLENKVLDIIEARAKIEEK